MKKILCKVLSHKWSEWKKGDQICMQTRICERCGQIQKEEIDHDWQPWVENSIKCKKNRKCTRCSINQEENLPHHWSDWNTIVEIPCREKRVCIKCKNEEFRETEHDWGGWELQMGKCTGKRICRNCKKIQIRAEKHSWSNWRILDSTDKYSQCQERHCEECDEKEFVGHKWIYGQTWYQGGQEWVETKCDVCGLESSEP